MEEEDSVQGKDSTRRVIVSISYLFITQSIQVNSYNSTLQKVYYFCICAGIPSLPYPQTHLTGYVNLKSTLAPQFQRSHILARGPTRTTRKHYCNTHFIHIEGQNEFIHNAKPMY